jgi:transcriptional regulator with XRE-family HTH domain
MTDSPENIFGLRVVAERERLDMTRSLLAGLSGVTERTIWRWERGDTEPQLDDAARVASALGVSLDYLAGRIDKRIRPRTKVA